MTKETSAVEVAPQSRLTLTVNTSHTTHMVDEKKEVSPRHEKGARTLASLRSASVPPQRQSLRVLFFFNSIFLFGVRVCVCAQCSVS
jgi:hypothetical protein